MGKYKYKLFNTPKILFLKMAINKKVVNTSTTPLKLSKVIGTLKKSLLNNKWSIKKIRAYIGYFKLFNLIFLIIIKIKIKKMEYLKENVL